MEFTPDKLEITLIDPVTENGPVEGRKYTLTHSDETGMLFLDIGNVYNYSAIDQDLRDEVLGRWLLPDNAPPMLIFYAYVGCEDFESAAKRYKIFYITVVFIIIKIRNCGIKFNVNRCIY